MKKLKTLASLCCLAVAIGYWSLLSQPCLAASRIKAQKLTANERLYLISLFQNSGFSKQFLKKFFFDKRLRKNPTVIKKTVYRIVGKGKRFYGYHSPQTLKRALKFLKRQRATLEAADTAFGVDKEVLVSILFIETNFGRFLGKYPIISVFSSILLENYHKNYLLSGKRKHDPVLRKRMKRIKRKAELAIKELYSFLRIVEKNGDDPMLYKGSFAGAFGIPQFLPSSYLEWGYDGDNDGRVNLFLFPDAIFSAANYLKAHGWKRGLKRKSNKKAIWLYNHSSVYVETVLRLAKKIKFFSGDAQKNAKRKRSLAY